MCFWGCTHWNPRLTMEIITHDILSVSKAYCPISLLSLMQETMQKLVNRNIRDETLGYVPYIYKNLPTHQGSPQKPQSIMSKVKYPRFRPTCPRGVQGVKAPRFLDTRHMKVVRSSLLHTDRLYPMNILALIFRGWVNPRHMDLSDAWENILRDTNRDWSRDIPTSSVVP